MQKQVFDNEYVLIDNKKIISIDRLKWNIYDELAGDKLQSYMFPALVNVIFSCIGLFVFYIYSQVSSLDVFLVIFINSTSMLAYFIVVPKLELKKIIKAVDKTIED